MSAALREARPGLVEGDVCTVNPRRLSVLTIFKPVYTMGLLALLRVSVYQSEEKPWTKYV
jgi:hypothetical protein